MECVVAIGQCTELKHVGVCDSTWSDGHIFEWQQTGLPTHYRAPTAPGNSAYSTAVCRSTQYTIGSWRKIPYAVEADDEI